MPSFKVLINIRTLFYREKDVIVFINIDVDDSVMCEEKYHIYWILFAVSTSIFVSTEQKKGCEQQQTQQGSEHHNPISKKC